MHYSVVIPVFNEEKNVTPLYKELRGVMKKLKKDYEIIFVDDASNDKTLSQLKKLPNVKIICMRKNSGQSSALDAGIKQARGKIIITMDGDGQNDPRDIPKLLKKLDKGYDAVCGWRHNRKDPFLKQFISQGAKYLRSYLVSDGVRDAGCTLRVYKNFCFEDLDLYGELHRMLPAMLKWRGFQISEEKVNHRARKYGYSKYNFMRTIKGFLDMLYIWFWRKFSSRPLHLFGSLSILFISSGAFLILFMAYLKAFQGHSIYNKIWPLVGFFLLLTGVQLLVTGLLAAQLVETSGAKKYYIKEIISNK